MVGRLRRVSSTVLLIAVLFVTPALARSTPAAAATPAPPNAGRLFDVSCASATFCMAVGTEGAATLTESWNGSVWSTVPSPNPSGTFSLLYSVSCVSATNCVAVGGFLDSASVGVGLTEVWNGTNWTIVSAPSQLPEQSDFYSVSCVSASPVYCVAVGSVGLGTPSSPSQTLTESWNGTAWSVISTPAPVYADSFLQSVSCVSATSCMAIGSTVEPISEPNALPVFSVQQMLVESWDGTSWSILTTPNEDSSDVLTSVSCTSSTSCVGAGVSTNSSTGVLDGLVDSWNGASWTVTDGPDLGAAPSTSSLGEQPAQEDVSSLSCLSAMDCMALGDTPGPGAGQQTLALSWNGTALSTVPSANPSSTNDAFAGVSCVSTTFCAGAGYLEPSSGLQQSLLETWNGATWSVAPEANTAVVVPSSGAAVGGTAAVLDATAAATAGVASVQFALSGGTYDQTVIGTATPTLYGYILLWNTTAVPAGTYTLQSLVTDDDGNTVYSQPVNVTVDHTPPTTAVLIPSTGASLQGTKAVLDATASAPDGVAIAKVQFAITGGSFDQTVIGTATPTLYGYILLWNTTSVPNGTYTLQSLATDAASNTAFSAGISVTVDNTPPSTSLLIPSNGATLFGPAILDAAASDPVGVTKVEFHLTGGTLNDASVATATPTIYGWIADWNTKTVPNGTYTLESVAYDAEDFSTHSAGITVNILNGPVAYVTDIGGAVTPVDTENNMPGRQINGLAGDPLAIAISPDGTTAYVSASFAGTVTPIDLLTGAPETPISLGANFLMGGIAVSPDGSTAYVGNENTGAVVPVDLATRSVGAPIPVCTIPHDAPAAIVVSPNGATAYVACTFSDTVVPIDTSTDTTGPPIPVGAGPQGLAITPNGATLYVANFGQYVLEGGQVTQVSNGTTVTPVDTATGTAGTPITVGTEPGSVAITPDGTTAYVANVGSDTVSPIDIATNTAGSPIAIDAVPSGVPDAIAITPDGTTVYVVTTSDSVVPIDTATNTAGTPVPAGQGSTAIAIG